MIVTQFSRMKQFLSKIPLDFVMKNNKMKYAVLQVMHEK